MLMRGSFCQCASAIHISLSLYGGIVGVSYKII